MMARLAPSKPPIRPEKASQRSYILNGTLRLVCWGGRAGHETPDPVAAGTSWQLAREIDSGMSGYSSLAVPHFRPRLLLEGCRSATSCAQVGETGRLLLLYEQSDETQVVMNPDRFVFIEL